jgi:hypothetical protein
MDDHGRRVAEWARFTGARTVDAGASAYHHRCAFGDRHQALSRRQRQRGSTASDDGSAGGTQRSRKA